MLEYWWDSYHKYLCLTKWIMMHKSQFIAAIFNILLCHKYPGIRKSPKVQFPKCYSSFWAKWSHEILYHCISLLCQRQKSRKTVLLLAQTVNLWTLLQEWNILPNFYQIHQVPLKIPFKTVKFDKYLQISVLHMVNSLVLARPYCYNSSVFACISPHAWRHRAPFH